MIASMPLTAAIARYQTKLQRQQMKNKDQRTSIMSEILNNIRSIKLYAWENSFAQRLFDVRNNKELAMLKKMGELSLLFAVSSLTMLPLFRLPFGFFQFPLVVHPLRRRFLLLRHVFESLRQTFNERYRVPCYHSLPTSQFPSRRQSSSRNTEQRRLLTLLSPSSRFYRWSSRHSSKPTFLLVVSPISSSQKSFKQMLSISLCLLAISNLATNSFRSNKETLPGTLYLHLPTLSYTITRFKISR